MPQLHKPISSLQWRHEVSSYCPGQQAQRTPPHQRKFPWAACLGYTLEVEVGGQAPFPGPTPGPIFRVGPCWDGPVTLSLAILSGLSTHERLQSEAHIVGGTVASPPGSGLAGQPQRVGPAGIWKQPSVGADDRPRHLQLRPASHTPGSCGL